MADPDPILMADVEALCELVDVLDNHDQKYGPDAVDEFCIKARPIVKRIRRIMVDPVDDSHLQESREMNKNPHSNRED